MSFAPHPVDGVAILLWATSPDTPALLATPFFHAAAAAAMEAPVEVYFTARSVHLLVPGTADRLRASAHFDKTIGETMREAHAHGAQFFACTDALHAHGIDPQALIPECRGHGGAVQFMARALDARWRTLVF
ncbi:MAG: DsrE family protein [Pseudomonadota bacterium]|nr:DsrE family protein [Pseudomonadota bacterium]